MRICLNYALALFFLLVQPCYAQERPDCFCQDVPALDQLSSFTSLNVDIQDRFGALQGSAFHPGTEAFRAQRLQSDVEALKKKICPKKKRVVSIVVRKVQAKNPAHGVTTNQVDSSMRPQSIYMIKNQASLEQCLSKAVAQEKAHAFANPETPSYVDMEAIAHQYCKNEANIEQNLLENYEKLLKAKTTDQITDLLSPDSPGDFLADSNGIPYSGMPTKDQLRIKILVDQLLASGNEDAALSLLKSTSSTMTTDQKLQVVRIMGAHFAVNHDKLRTNGGPNSGGVVTMSELMQAAQHNRFQKSSDTPRKNAGVCRDIASAQGKLLKALGFKETYVVAFLSKGTWHADVIAQDPDQKKKYYKFNYSELTTQTGGEGATVLNQGSSDNTAEYHIYLPDGRLVSKIPSELGKILREAAGFTPISPFARPTSSLNAVNVQLSKKTAVRLFEASDQLGNEYMGAAVTKDWIHEKNQSLRSGVVYSHRSSPDALLEMKPQSISTIYTQLQYVAKSREYGIYKDQIRAKIDATVEAILGVTIPDSPAALDNEYGWYKRAFGGLEAYVGGEVVKGDPEKDKTIAALRAQTHVTLGTNDIRSGDLTSLRAYPIELLTSAEVRRELSKTKEGRAYLTASVAVLLDYFGPKILTEVGYIDPGMAVKIRGVGRIKENTPAFVEGSERSAEVLLSKNFSQFNIPMRLNLSAGVKESPREGGDEGIIYLGNGAFQLDF